MKLVADANAVISAIVRASVSRNLLFHPGLDLYSPAYLFDELEEHREEIMGKAGLDDSEFRDFIILLGRVLTVLPAAAYSAYLDEARKVLVDDDDLPYAASAIALTVRNTGLPDSDFASTALREGVDPAAARIHDIEECGIWTNDPHFTKRAPEFLQLFGIKIWATHELHAFMSH